MIGRLIFISTLSKTGFNTGNGLQYNKNKCSAPGTNIGIIFVWCSIAFLQCQPIGRSPFTARASGRGRGGGGSCWGPWHSPTGRTSPQNDVTTSCFKNPWVQWRRLKFGQSLANIIIQILLGYGQNCVDGVHVVHVDRPHSWCFKSILKNVFLERLLQRSRTPVAFWYSSIHLYFSTTMTTQFQCSRWGVKHLIHLQAYCASSFIRTLCCPTCFSGFPLLFDQSDLQVPYSLVERAGCKRCLLSIFWKKKVVMVVNGVEDTKLSDEICKKHNVLHQLELAKFVSTTDVRPGWGGLAHLPAGRVLMSEACPGQGYHVSSGTALRKSSRPVRLQWMVQ